MLNNYARYVTVTHQKELMSIKKQGDFITPLSFYELFSWYFEGQLNQLGSQFRLLRSSEKIFNPIRKINKYV